MLIVKSGLPGNPLRSFTIPTSAVARVVTGLAAQDRSFYYEPLPDGLARVQVDPEHASAVIALLIEEAAG